MDSSPTDTKNIYKKDEKKASRNNVPIQAFSLGGLFWKAGQRQRHRVGRYASNGAKKWRHILLGTNTTKTSNVESRPVSTEKLPEYWRLDVIACSVQTTRREMKWNHRGHESVHLSWWSILHEKVGYNEKRNRNQTTFFCTITADFTCRKARSTM